MKKTLYLIASFLAFNTSVIAQYIQGDSTSLEQNYSTNTLGKKIPSKEFSSSINDLTLKSTGLDGEINILNALKGQFSGLSINSTSGSPGTSVSAIIRGSNSVLNKNTPLIILDGIPISNMEWGNKIAGVDLSNRLIDLNVEDIESVSILKGPVSTTLYGVRGGNGVIILNTKQAPSSFISIHSSIFTEKVNKLPLRQSKYAQGRPLSGLSIWRGPETQEGFSWGPEISRLEFDGSDYPYDQNGRLVPIGQGISPAKAYDPTTFFVNGRTYKLHVALSKSTEKVNYYLSGSRTYSTGFAPRATFGKSTFTGKIDAALSSKIAVGFSGHLSNSGGYRLQKGSNLKGIMLGLLRTTPSFDNGNGKVGNEAADNLSSFQLDDGTQRSYRAGVYDSPYWSVNKNPFEDNVFRFIGNFSLQYQLKEWLRLEGKIGLDQFSEDRKGGFDINPGRSLGSAFISKINYYGLNTDVFAKMHKQITPDLDLNAHLGFNYFQTQTTDNSTTGSTFIEPSIFEIDNTQTQEDSKQTIQKKIAGALAMVDFNYKNYLLLNLSARNDWSSALPSKTRSYLSYAINGGFVVSALPVFKNSNTLSHFKINAGYGKAANDAPAHLTRNYFVPAQILGDGYIDFDYNRGREIIYPSGQGYEESRFLGNNDLKPETTTSFEAGINLAFFKNSIGLNAVYYNENTTDVIFFIDLPGSNGYNSTAENAGEISNKGIELDFWAKPIKTNTIAWNFSVNFTKSKNLVEKAPFAAGEVRLNGFSSTSSNIIEGETYSVIIGNAFLRNQEGQLIINEDGWPLADGSGKKVLGNPNPDWTMGIHNSIRIGKNLTVSALLEIKQGGDMWCGTCGVMDYFGTSQQSGDERDEITVFKGVHEDGTVNDIPVALADPINGLGGNYRVRYAFGGLSEMSIYDASWIRLRTLGLHYDLSSIVPEKIPITGFTISIFANNLWLRTDYPGIDPETNLAGTSNGYGLDYFNMPGVKSYGASIKLNF